MAAGIFARTLLIISTVMLVLTSCSNYTHLKLEGGMPEPIVEIVVWDKPFAGSAEKPYYERMFQEFEQKYPDIRVIHMEAAFQKEREQFMTAVAGGEQPDLYNAAFPDMESYIDQGIPADITELWSNYPDSTKYSPVAMAASEQEGQIYGIPNFMYVTVLAYNKRIFEDNGIDPKEAFRNWDTFAAAAEQVTERSGNPYGYAILGTEWADWFYEYYVWQAGGDLTSKNQDGTVQLTFNSDAAVQALSYYQDLRFRDGVTQLNTLQSLDDNKKDFYAGRAATMIVASNWFGEMRESGFNMDEIGVAMFPAGPAGVSLAQVGGGIWILNPQATEEKQRAAFTYATFMTSKYAQDELLRFQMEQGMLPNLLSVRVDIDPMAYAEGMPEELVDNIQKASEESRLEYYLKSRLSPYVSAAVQEVLLNEDASPYDALTRAQEKAQREVIDPYNIEFQ
ncbi:extracellular solute-binding protein [Paenibacillus sp. strain BS8-2]